MPAPMTHEDVDPQINELTGRIVDAMLEVHRHLGAGLLESLYAQALAHELQLRGLHVRREVPIPLLYKEAALGGGFRLDLLVRDQVIVEVKAVEALLPVHFAQLDSYLRLTGMRVGLLVNYHAPTLKGNLHRRLGRPLL